MSDKADSARLRLTDAERQALEAVLDDPDLVLGDAREPLRGLLERTQPNIAACDNPPAAGKNDYETYHS